MRPGWESPLPLLFSMILPQLGARTASFMSWRFKRDDCAGRRVWDKRLLRHRSKDINEAVLAPNCGKIIENSRGRGDSQPGLIFPAQRPRICVKGVKEKIFGTNQNRISCDNR